VLLARAFLIDFTRVIRARAGAFFIYKKEAAGILSPLLALFAFGCEPFQLLYDQLLEVLQKQFEIFL
jgi:hypothetical protein